MGWKNKKKSNYNSEHHQDQSGNICWRVLSCSKKLPKNTSLGGSCVYDFASKPWIVWKL